MAQAVLIVGHSDMPQIKRLCRQLKSTFNVYLHLDTKMVVAVEDIEELKACGINVYSRYKVDWGGTTVLKPELYLLRKALKDENNIYFHLISGQDFPVTDPKKIYDFYEGSSDIHMTLSKAAGEKIAGEDKIWWVKYYFDYSKVNRRSFYGKLYHRANILRQRIGKVDKFKKYKIDPDKIYHGSVWTDMPRDAAEYVLNYMMEDKAFKRLMLTSYCADEFYKQTILVNSPFKNRIKQDIHRFIKWEKQYDSFPAVLDMRNYKEIRSGDFHFARKFTSKHSESLMEKIISEF